MLNTNAIICTNGDVSLWNECVRHLEISQQRFSILTGALNDSVLLVVTWMMSVVTSAKIRIRNVNHSPQWTRVVRVVKWQTYYTQCLVCRSNKVDFEYFHNFQLYLTRIKINNGKNGTTRCSKRRSIKYRIWNERRSGSSAYFQFYGKSNAIESINFLDSFQLNGLMPLSKINKSLTPWMYLFLF